MRDDLGPIEKIRKLVDHPYTSPETIVVQSDLVTFTADDLARLLQERDEAAVRIRTLEAELAAFEPAPVTVAKAKADGWDEAAKFLESLQKFNPETGESEPMEPDEFVSSAVFGVRAIADKLRALAEAG